MGDSEGGRNVEVGEGDVAISVFAIAVKAASRRAAELAVEQ